MAQRGRPTDYNEEILTKTDEYLQQCLDKEELPQVAGLAIYLNVARRTLYEWAQKHEDFLHIFEVVLSMQEQWLVAKGLIGKYNPTITKLLLAKHGHRDSQDITTNGKALPTPIMTIPQNDVPADPGDQEGSQPQETH